MIDVESVAMLMAYSAYSPGHLDTDDWICVECYWRDQEEHRGYWRSAAARLTIRRDIDEVVPK